MVNELRKCSPLDKNGERRIGIQEKGKKGFEKKKLKSLDIIMLEGEGGGESEGYDGLNRPKSFSLFFLLFLIFNFSRTLI